MILSDLIPVAVVALVPATMFLHRRLNRIAQPLRLELAEKGELLLASRDLPPEIRSQVNFMLDTAFGMGWLIVGSVILLPFVAVFVILFQPKVLARTMRDFSALSPEQRVQLHDLMRLHDRITTANHPALQMILEGEFLLLSPLALIAIAIAMQPLTAKLDRDVVLNVLEMGESRFFRSRAHAH